MKKIILCALALIVCTASLNTALAHGRRHSVRFSTGQPGLDEDHGTLFVALPIINEGTAVASNVEVRSVKFVSATRVTPSTLPVTLGDIAANQRAILDASFISSSLVPDRRYLLKVKGTYVLEGRTFRFVVRRRISLPLPASGEDAASTDSAAESNVVSGAPFPPDVIVGPPEAEVNPPGPPIPTGPLRGSVTPTSPPAEALEPIVLDDAALGVLRVTPQQAANPVAFVRNTPFGVLPPNPGAPPDPSGASSGNVVLASGNTYASLSTDGGRTFTELDPTTIFSNRDATGNLIDGGLCCDQVIHYIPSINRFVWLMQFNRALRPTDPAGGPATGPNRLRIAVASPEDIINSRGTAWTFWDLTSATFNLGNDWMDYPDIAVGDNFLYISVDAVGAAGLMVVRIPLRELRNGRTINPHSTDPARSKSAYLMHIMQNPGNEVFWAGHLSNSRVQVFSWREDSTRYFSRDVDINTWPNRDFSSITPDGTTNWLQIGPAGGNILGATRRLSRDGTNELFFAWTAGRGGGFPHPHIQVLRLDRSNFNVLDQFAIWNNGFAFAFPALTTNSNNEVAASLAVGGPTLFPTHAVGFVEDGQYFGSSGSDGANNRNGDYYTVRPHFPNSKLFSAFGYGIRLLGPTMSTNCNVAPFCRFDPHYVLFGRASDILADLVPYEAADWRFKKVARGELEGFQAGPEPPGFSTGQAAFGSGGNCPLQSTVHTDWSVDTDMLLRRTIDLRAGTRNVRVSIRIDNDFVAFWNGVEIGRGVHEECPDPARDEFVVNVDDSRLNVGVNLLAIRAIDRGLESFVDTKIRAILP